MVLTVSCEIRVHFHPRLRGGVPNTRGGIIFCFRRFNPYSLRWRRRFSSRTYLGIGVGNPVFPLASLKALLTSVLKVEPMRGVAPALTALLDLVSVRACLSGSFIHADKGLFEFRAVDRFALLSVRDLAPCGKTVRIALPRSYILRGAELLDVRPLSRKRLRLVVKHVQNMKCVGSSFGVAMPMLSHSSSLAQRSVADVSGLAHLVLQAVNFV